jgi:hypothetical protein
MKLIGRKIWASPPKNEPGREIKSMGGNTSGDERGECVEREK